METQPAPRSICSSRETLVLDRQRSGAGLKNDPMNGSWHLSCVMCVANRFFCKFQCRIQRLHELIELDGLGYIEEKSYFQAPLDVAWHGIGTDGNDGDVRRGRIFTQDFQGFEAVDAGQIDVHQQRLQDGAL